MSDEKRLSFVYSSSLGCFLFVNNWKYGKIEMIKKETYYETG
jgi:hypothetical protein